MYPYHRCKLRSKNFGPPNISESHSGFGSSSSIFLDSFWTYHQLYQISCIFRPYGLVERKSVNDIAVCISPSTSVTVREHLVCRKYFLNAVSNDKYLGIFGRQNISDILIWTLDWIGFEKFSNFLNTFSYINFAPFQKISTQGSLRSGHQVRSSDLTSKNVQDFAVTTVFEVSI